MQNAVLRRIWYILSWARNDLAMMAVILFICSISRCDHTVKCASVVRLQPLVEFFFFLWVKIGTYYAFPLYTDMFVSSRVLSLPVFVRNTAKNVSIVVFPTISKALDIWKWSLWKLHLFSHVFKPLSITRHSSAAARHADFSERMQLNWSVNIYI